MSPPDQRLRNANPAPNPDGVMDAATYEAILAEVNRSSGLHFGLTDGPMRPRRIAAALLVIVTAVGGLWLVAGLSGQTSTEVVASQSPVDLAMAYLDARNRGDVAAAKAVLADDAEIIEYPGVTGQGLEATFSYLRTLDTRIDTEQCEIRSDDPAAVDCQYRLEDRLLTQANSEPLAGTLRFATDGGRILRVENDLDVDRYFEAAIDPWWRWLDRAGLDSQAMYRWVFHLGGRAPAPRLEELPTIDRLVNAYAPVEVSDPEGS